MTNNRLAPHSLGWYPLWENLDPPLSGTISSMQNLAEIHKRQWFPLFSAKRIRYMRDSGAISSMLKYPECMRDSGAVNVMQNLPLTRDQ